MDKDGNPIASWYDQLGYDVKLVDHWYCPPQNSVALLTMPNIPKPMFYQNPRLLLGRTNWDKMRKQCYADANDTCEICGCFMNRKLKEYPHAHELYHIDYTTQEMEFVRPICLCQTCHCLCIHTGRALTMYKQGNPYNTADKLLYGAEHCFKLISEYNKAHPDEEPLRVYQAWLDYLKLPELEPEMRRLIKKYDIKFYRVLNKWENKKHYICKWKMLIGDTWYQTPYSSMEDIMEEVKKQSRENPDKKYETKKFSDGIDRILGSVVLDNDLKNF